MLVISIKVNPAKSFIIVIYGAGMQELARYQVPIAVAAPFANRIARDVLPDWDFRFHEPSYTLEPCSDRTLQRSSLPIGPTSLYGERYIPDAGPAIHMRSDAQMPYFEVRLFDFQKELYKGIYTMDDIFAHGAHFLLQNRILKGGTHTAKGPYLYEVLPDEHAMWSIASDLLPEDAYKIDGIFRLPPRVKETPRIQFRRVPQDPLPEQDPATFGVTKVYGKGDVQVQAGRVFIPYRRYEDLYRRLKLSLKKEEGGYLLGNVYRLPGSPEDESSPDFRWVVEVTDLVMAEDTVGSPALLLFTGESWSKISRRRERDYPTRRLVGWFHTHLFPSTDTFGLSGLDKDMHSWYLPKPWQIAILLNQENEHERKVRCYQRSIEGELAEAPFEVVKPSIVS